MIRFIQMAALALVVASSQVLAQDYEAGLAAYDAGDYEAALAEWRPLAEQGNAAAQNNLGAKYDKGEGVLQDYATAHMWFNLAGSNGDADGGENRDKAAAKMTPAAIEEAQRRARVCLESQYKDCD